MISSAPRSAGTPSFELARDGTLYCLQQHIGLILRSGPGLLARAVFRSLVSQ